MSPNSDPAIHADPNDSWHGIITKKGQFPPEQDRYHLYIGLFCPFAHRANLVRHLKGIESIIDISIVKAYPKGDDNGWPGWRFNGENGPDDVYPGATEDKLFRIKFLHQVYFKADSDYQGRYSVPVLWDKKQNTIVNNESAELLRWLPTAFDDLHSEDGADLTLDLYPDPLKEKINDLDLDAT